MLDTGLEARILEAFDKRPLLSREALQRALGREVDGALEPALDDLLETGFLIRKGDGRFSTPEAAGLVRGRLQANRRGFAFVLRPDDDDLFVGPDNLHGALHGDTVLAKPTGQRRDAVVVRVVHRANETVVGTLDHKGDRAFLVPADTRLVTPIRIARKDVAAKKGDAAVVRVIDFGDGERPPSGVLIENLGPTGAPGVDVAMIVKSRGIREDFPPEVLREAERVAVPPAAEEIERRQDLRSKTIFTIDAADAKDLDDAISLECLADGWRLGVHIADVTHYVRAGGVLDQEARERATSVYLVDRVIPMLPRAISNGVASLGPEADRLTVSAFLNFDGAGRPRSVRFRETVIRTRARLTYDGVNAALDGAAEGVYRELLPTLQDMARLRDLLRDRRLERGAVDFDLYEDRVVLDDEGKPTAIVRRARTPADSLIEEFMLAANEAVARWANERHLPFLFRVHEPPEAEKVTTLRTFLRRFSLPVAWKEKPSPKELQGVLEAAKGQVDEQLISTVVLRSMMRARYDVEPLGHFGLAAPDYTHFTSPIRRYPDLQIHRILKEVWEKGGLTKAVQRHLVDALPAVADHASLREKHAEEAERESVDMKKAEYMAEHIGEVHPGLITGVTNFGLFVEMELGVEGMIPLASLTDDYYVLDEGIFSLIGERTHRTFRLGDAITVKVVQVNVRDRRVELGLVREAGVKERGRVDTRQGRSYNGGKRHRTH